MVGTQLILVVGDVIDDVIVIPQGKVRTNTDTTAKIEKTMGGSAANVAAWLSYLGVAVDFVGCVSLEDVRRVSESLGQHGVNLKLQHSPKSTGSLVVLVEGESRTMLTDRGANSDLNLTAIEISDYSVVYLSGYSLLGKSKDQIVEFANRVKRAGALLAIDPGSYGFILDHGVDQFRELMGFADIVFPNSEEEELLGLAGRVPLCVVTRGEAGAEAIFRDGGNIFSNSQPTKLIDPTGAGDAFCAGFLARLIAEPQFRELPKQAIQAAIQSGVESGAKAVQLLGARP